MKVTIYHNPRCSKSRQALALLEEQGADIETVEYLRTPPDHATVRSLANRLGVDVRELLRTGETEYAELGLGDPSLDETRLINAIVDNPILLQRPIVLSGDKAVIGRPPENVLALFDERAG